MASILWDPFGTSQRPSGQYRNHKYQEQRQIIHLHRQCITNVEDLHQLPKRFQLF